VRLPSAGTEPTRLAVAPEPMDSLPRSKTGRCPSPAYVVGGYRLRSGTRFSSSHRNKRVSAATKRLQKKAASQHESPSAAVPSHQPALRAHLDPPCRACFKCALGPVRAGSFSHQSGSTRLSTKCVFYSEFRDRKFVDLAVRVILCDGRKWGYGPGPHVAASCRSDFGDMLKT
jgi:hypothetical protein